MVEGAEKKSEDESAVSGEPEALPFPPLFSSEEFDEHVESRAAPSSGMRVLEPGEREREERLQLFRVKEAPLDEAAALATVEKFSPRLAEKLRAARRIGGELAELANLGIDERGNRSGFPPEVFDALMHLAARADHYEDAGRIGAHGECAPATAPQCPWGSKKR